MNTQRNVKVVKNSLRPVPTGGFNPTLLDDTDDVFPHDSSLDEPSLENHINLLIADTQEMRSIAQTVLGDDLSESVVRNILLASEDIGHSQRKILAAHMHIGGSMHEIYQSIQNELVAKHGQSKTVLDRAAHLAHQYLKEVHKFERPRISLYIRVYKKFFQNAAAVEILTFTDMSMLATRDTTPEMIDAVVEARRDNSELTKAEVKELIASLKAKNEQISDNEDRLQVLSTKLHETMGMLEETRNAAAIVEREKDAMRRDNITAKSQVESMQVELARKGTAYTSLQFELAKREGEVERLVRDVAAQKARVETREVQVEKLPAPYVALSALLDTTLAEQRAAEVALETTRGELADMQQQLAAATAAIGNGERLEKEMQELMGTFGDFAARFAKALLLANGEGDTARYRPMFSALADMIGKYHQDMTANLQKLA